MLNFLYYITLASLVLGQFSALSKSQGANIYLFDVLVFFTSFVYFIYCVGVLRKFKIPKSFIFLTAFLVVGGVSLLFNISKFPNINTVLSLFYLFRFFAYTVFALSKYNLILESKLSQIEIKKSVVLSGVILTFFGVLQLIILPDFQKLDPTLGWDPHQNRLASTFFDPNFVGAYLVICIAFLLNLYQATKKITPKFIITFFILLFGLIFTFSRSAWLMFAVLVLIYGIYKSRILLLISLALMFSAYFFVPRIQTRITGTTDPADSAQFRLVSWKNSIKIISRNPVLGVGFDSYRYVQKSYGFIDEDSFLSHAGAGSDSSLLFILATTGIAGTLLFLKAVLLPFTQKNSENVFLYKIVFIMLAVESQFINSVFYPQIMFLWLLALSFSYL